MYFYHKLNTSKRFILVATLVVVTFITGCVTGSGGGASNFFKSPRVRLTSITPKTMNGDNLAFDVGLKVHNPNMLPLPIDNIKSNIALNGLSLLSASGKAPGVIPANGSQNVTLSADVGMAQMRQLMSTLRGPNVNYNLNGSVGVLGGVALPIQQSGQVNVVNLATQLLRSKL